MDAQPDQQPWLLLETVIAVMPQAAMKANQEALAEPATLPSREHVRRRLVLVAAK